MRKRIGDFTVLELLVVVAIIALLAGLSFAGYRQAWLAKERMRCLNSLRQWSIALEMYAFDHNSTYPRSGDLFNKTPEVGVFMTNYLHVADTGSYSTDHLPMAMCRSGVATYQNSAAYIGWSLYAGYSGPSPLQNDYLGIDWSNEQTVKASGLAIIGCVTANQGPNWTGH